MSENKLDKLLADLKKRLINEESFGDDIIGHIKVPLSLGGLSGNIEINAINTPAKAL